MEAYESSTVGPTSVADTVRVPSKVPSKVHVYEDKPYCRPYSTVLVRCTAVHVHKLHIQYIFMDGNRIFYHTFNVRSYQIFEGTLYFRKYFRRYLRRYESTKVRKYFRTKYFRTFVRKYFRKYERKVALRRYESKLLRK